MRSGVTLVFVQDMKKHALSNETLWDLVAEILTELSERDSVRYRIRATETSLTAKLDLIDEDTHDSEGC